MPVAKVVSAQFWMTVRLALHTFRSSRLFQPFLLYAGAQLLVFSLLVAFYAPGISLVGEPLVRLLGGERATHYPQFYIAFPFLIEKLYVVLHILLGSLLAGTATAMLLAYFTRRPYGLGDALAKARGSYRKLVGVIAVADLIAIAFSTLSYRLATGGTGGVLAAPFVARGFAVFLALVVHTLVAYAVPSLIISNASLIDALRRSVQIAVRNPVMTFLLVAVSFAPHVPLRYFASKSVFIVENLKPELVAWVIGMDILVGILTALFLIAGITRLYLFATAEE